MARRFVRSGSGRSTFWAAIQSGNSTHTAAGGVILNASSAGLLAFRPFTILRLYFELLLVSDQEAAVEKQGIAFGVCVVSDQAAAIGVSAIPTPETDAGSDLWMLHSYMFGEESRLVDKTLPARSLKVESKAMRKVNDDQDFLTVAEFVNIGGGSILSSAGRVLIKTH